MPVTRYEGLFAAAYTPFNESGEVRIEPIGLMVDWLLRRHVNGFYVCGSTGEGMSLTSDERRRVADAYVTAVAGRVPVFVQVGHNSLREAQQLASHAASIGATAISATCPSYFKVDTVRTLVESMAQVAAGAPSLPTRRLAHRSRTSIAGGRDGQNDLRLPVSLRHEDYSQ